MIYLVSKNLNLFNTDLYTKLSVNEALQMLNTWNIIQFDIETSGRDPHICSLLCAQFGNKSVDTQIVVDCLSYNITLFKNILETKLLVGHNLKFDIQFLYNYSIIPTYVWDTMIVEQVLYLGYNRKFFHFGLKDVALRRLGIDIDKSVRGEIIWRGLDPIVISYASGDVRYLEDIKESQEQDIIEKDCKIAVDIENNFVRVIAYLEWCGIKLDEEKWLAKMAEDQTRLKHSLTALNEWVENYSLSHPCRQFVSVNMQGDLFTGFDKSVKCIINWASSKQVIPFFQLLGFNTTIEDNKTGETKDSVLEKVLSSQKGIADDFLQLYLDYKETFKECSTYGINYLNSINPKTGRIHTTFWQLGADSSRMSCGSKSENTDLAAYKGLPSSACKYVQIQNLPATEVTRSAFVSEKGNLFTSCDFSALESRLGADIYNEPEMLEEFLHRSGDMHSLCAYLVFKDEIPRNINISDIKDKFPKLRKKIKPIEFSQQFGGGVKAVASSLGISISEAAKFVKAYADGFKGIAKYKACGSNFVRTHGYITICVHTGLKLYWEDWPKWREIEDMSKEERMYVLTKKELDEHDRAGAKWDRLALNSVTQGTGAEIIKLSTILFFDYIIKHSLFNIVKLCNMVHDEICIEYPEHMPEIADILKQAMEKAASQLCKKLPIPAEAATGDHWIH